MRIEQWLDHKALDELYHHVIDFADIGITILDQQWHIVYWSNQMQRLYAISRQEVIGRHILEVFPTLKDEGLMEPFLAALAGQVSVKLSVRHQSLKKGIRYIDFRFCPQKNAAQEIVEVIILVRDITEKVTELHAFQKYEHYLANILNDAADAIIILDEQDRIKMWNRAAETMYGYHAAEVMDQEISLIVPTDPDSQREIQQISEEVRRKGFVRDRQARRLTRDGRQITISLTRTAIWNENGEYIGSSLLARDITEKLRLERQMIQSEKLAAIGQLAAGIAHEVSSPLSSISALTQLLQEKTSDAWQSEKLQLIHQQIERIYRTVRELVDFSKPAHYVIKPLSINTVIQEARRIVQYDHRLKYIPIETHFDARIPDLPLSYDQLLQVFINLLLNAGDALENCAAAKIEIITHSQVERIEILVKDNGVGIEAANLNKIFTPFFTTKPAGKGTGLGLWVSYQIIQHLGGEFSVESEPGRGTTFKIYLPLVMPANQAPQTA
ncbi:PAS domain S-box protein [candidate division KSB1 bacterium]|nr:PAS domain S-box protein [candidate division KSB1 bacterium]